MKETKYITTVSIGSVIISLIIFIPAGMMGVAAKGAGRIIMILKYWIFIYIIYIPTYWTLCVPQITDWPSLPGFTKDMFGNEGDNILPLTMRFLTPTVSLLCFKSVGCSKVIW